MLLRRLPSATLWAALLLAATVVLQVACHGGSASLQPPSGLTYATNPASYTTGVLIAANRPAVEGGAVQGYTVAPVLPAGLILNSTTGVISGTPTAIAPLTSYTITATNTAGAAVAILNLKVTPPAPAITSQPASQTLSFGAVATFRVVAAGTGPLTYQWQRNASDIPAATEATYSTPSTSHVDDGAAFRVVVKDSYGGQVTSQVAVLGVLAGVLQPLASPSAARYDHAAVRLADGRILVVGGRSPAAPTTSAELFDPASGTSSPTQGPLSQARVSFTATLLKDGRVLLVGGWNASGFMGSAELFDPTTGRFSATGNLVIPRALHSATLLADGSVLIVGGMTGQAVRQAERFDPAAGAFRLTQGDPAAGRVFHSASLLTDGKVLVAGGWNATSLASAELYDPVSDRFSPMPSLIQRRYLHSATVLADGKVLLAGGLGPAGTLATAELFNPTTGTFTVTGSLSEPRYIHAATALADGKVLVTGGWNGSATRAAFERYDPETGRFTFTSSPLAGFHSHTATLLADGKVLVLGGYSSGPLSTAALWRD